MWMSRAKFWLGGYPASLLSLLHEAVNLNFWILFPVPIFVDDVSISTSNGRYKRDLTLTRARISIRNHFSEI